MLCWFCVIKNHFLPDVVFGPTLPNSVQKQVGVLLEDTFLGRLFACTKCGKKKVAKMVASLRH